MACSRMWPCLMFLMGWNTEKIFLRTPTIRYHEKKQYYKPLSPLPVTQLSTARYNRILQSKKFKAIKNIIHNRSKLLKAASTTIPLQPDAFEKWASENNFDELDEDEISEDSKLFKAENHQAEKQRLALNIASKTMNEYTLQTIQQDIYIEEAFRVLLDLVQLQKSKNH